MTKVYLTIFVLLIALNSQGQDIKYDEVIIDCLDLNYLNKETIIATNEEYEDILDKKSPYANCNSNSYPEINFSRSILLGLMVQGAGCSASTHSIKVYKSENKTVFEVNISQKGGCRMAFQKMVWVTIPKEHGKQITFVRTYEPN